MSKFIFVILTFYIVKIVCAQDDGKENSSMGITKKYMEVCLEENNIDPDFFDIPSVGDSDLSPPSKNQVNCYIACLYNKVGIFTENGIVTKLNSEQEDIVQWTAEQRDACVKKAQGDICELAGCLEETQSLFT